MSPTKCISHLQKDSVDRAEHKSEVQPFIFLTSTCEQLNKQSEAAARAKQQKHHHIKGQLTSHSSIIRSHLKLSLRMWLNIKRTEKSDELMVLREYVNSGEQLVETCIPTKLINRLNYNTFHFHQVFHFKTAPYRNFKKRTS